MCAKLAKTIEAGVSHNTQVNAQIPELVARIAAVASDDSFHSKTVYQIRQKYGISMTKKEEERWRTYRNQVNIQKTSQELQRQKAERDAKKELITFTLLGLTNKRLSKKITQLEHQHKNTGGVGKNSAPQLVRALALHTLEEIEEVIDQIQTFTDKQKASAHHAITTIFSIRNAIRINQRNMVLISQLPDDDLRNEFSELFTSPATKNWPPLFENIITTKLQQLGEKQAVLEFEHRVQQLQTAGEFTQQIKDSVLEHIAAYIANNF